jgi:hypothetical protein
MGCIYINRIYIETKLFIHQYMVYSLRYITFSKIFATDGSSDIALQHHIILLFPFLNWGFITEYGQIQVDKEWLQINITGELIKCTTAFMIFVEISSRFQNFDDFLNLCLWYVFNFNIWKGVFKSLE